jgi:hypothetical protein
MNWIERRETPCEHCQGLNWKIVPTMNRGGHEIHPLVCGDCGYRSKVCAPKTVVENYAKQIGVTVTYQLIDEDLPCCEVCNKPGAEWHHWAPWYLFGNEAERWPKSWLCQSCHTRWHQVIATGVQP